MNFIAMTALTVLALVLGMIALYLLGGRLGQRLKAGDDDKGNSAAETAVFSLLGLLLGFTFFGAASRLEDRRHLVTQEANNNNIIIIGPLLLLLPAKMLRSSSSMSADFCLPGGPVVQPAAAVAAVSSVGQVPPPPLQQLFRGSSAETASPISLPLRCPSLGPGDYAAAAAGHSGHGPSCCLSRCASSSDSSAASGCQ